MGSDICLTTVHLSQNEFFSGQKAQVRLQCDNTKCSKGIRSFKFKLYRKYNLVKKQGCMASSGGYVSIAKWPGIEAKSKCDKVFDVDLPQNELTKGD